MHIRQKTAEKLAIQNACAILQNAYDDGVLQNVDIIGDWGGDSMNKRHSMDFTTGSVSKKLVLFALPILASNILQQLYNAADRAVVGQFAGKTALAAVGSTGSATTMLLNIFIGLAVGANIVSSNLLGARKTEELRRNMHTSILLALFCGVMLMGIGVFVCEPLLRLMSCPDTVIDQATLYMRIYFCGVPASLMYNFGSGILRTHGDSKRPMRILALSGIVNVVLNLILVIVFHMSVAGVALATIASQYVTAVWVLLILFDPKGEYQLSVKELKLHKKELISIIRVGLPCGLNGIVYSFSNVVIQSTVNSFGDTLIAGNVAADGITGFIYQVIAATYSASVSFAGQCYGAGKIKRINRLMGTAMLLSSSVLAVLCGIMTACPRLLLSIYNSDPTVIELGIPKMLIVGWAYILYGLSDIILACLRGMRKTAIPTVFNIMCVCGVRMFWVLFVFPLSPTTTVLYLCYPVSYTFSVAALGIYYIFVYRKKVKNHLAIT